MSLLQMHQSACASCRLRTLLSAKQHARARVPLAVRWPRKSYVNTTTANNNGSLRQFHAYTSNRQNTLNGVRTTDYQSRSLDSEHQRLNDEAERLQARVQELEAKVQAEIGAADVAEEVEVDDNNDNVNDDVQPLPQAIGEGEDADDLAVKGSFESPLTPDEAARLAKKEFGYALPEGYLDAEEYRAYERMFGAPIRILKPGEEDVLDFEEGEVMQEELGEEEDVGTGVLRESEDGRLEEVQYIEEEAALEEDEEFEGGEEGDEVDMGAARDARRKLGPGFEGLDEQTVAELAALQVEGGGRFDGEGDEESEDPFQRTHPLTAANRFGTPLSTLQLPKDTLVDPIHVLISGLPHKHMSESADRIFGGPGLPYSTSTPKRGLTMPQKAIPLDPYQGRMSEIEADVYMATIMPGVYATAYSIVVETRKRLGSSWLEGLLNKEGGPRILDAGGAGAGVLAAREVFRAEWERMHDTSEDPDAVREVAQAGGQTGGAPIPAPKGKATVLTASDSLRTRASSLLDETTFLPRLPDYIHASDEQAREKGKFDIVFAPHTLWQIKEEHMRKQHIANLWSMVSNDGGVLILFEKGVPRGFEMVAAAREMLLEKRIASPDSNAESNNIDIYDSLTGEAWAKEGPQKDVGMIVAPCTNHADCPMYIKGSGVAKGRKDHCHFTQRYIRPPFLQKLLGAKDRNHEDVQFSYLSIMRGRDLRDPLTPDGGLIQGPLATSAAFAGYEHGTPESAMPDPTPSNEFDPTAPAIPDVSDIYGSAGTGLVDASGTPHSLSLPRAVLPPLKRHGHVILDVCTPSGTLERWTVPKSFSRQAYRDARKAGWGDLWALGAKTRVSRNVRIGQGKDETGGVDKKKGAIDVKGRGRKTRDGEDGGVEGKKKGGASGGGAKNVIEVGYDSKGNIKEEDIKIKNMGRMRTGKKVKGIRDKRDKKGTGNGRRKAGKGDE